MLTAISPDARTPDCRTDTTNTLTQSNSPARCEAILFDVMFISNLCVRWSFLGGVLLRKVQSIVRPLLMAKVYQYPGGCAITKR